MDVIKNFYFGLSSRDRFSPHNRRCKRSTVVDPSRRQVGGMVETNGIFNLFVSRPHRKKGRRSRLGQGMEGKLRQRSRYRFTETVTKARRNPSRRQTPRLFGKPSVWRRKCCMKERSRTLLGFETVPDPVKLFLPGFVPVFLGPTRESWRSDGETVSVGFGPDKEPPTPERR